MAYYNNADDASFYTTPSTSNGFNAYPFLSQMSAANFGASDIFSDDWNVDGRPGDMVGSSTSLRAEANFESVPSVTSYPAQTNGYDQLSYPDHYWSMTGQYGESYRSGVATLGNSFATVRASETSIVDPIPSSIPFDYWGATENGLSTSAFHANVQTQHQPSIGSTGTGLMPARRFHPYETPRARSNEYRNAEVGSSTPAPPLVPYVAPSTVHPPGGTSEATADAEHNQTITEEGTAPTARRPQGTGEPRDWRIRNSQDIRKLCVWAKEWENLRKLPSHEKALGVTLGAVAKSRAPVYPGPRLLKGKTKRSAQVKKGAEAERERRKGTRELYEELSQYYLLPAKMWGTPELLLKVLDDVEGLPKPPP